MKTINNDIQETLVSFEVAQLLKEKGFDCTCKIWYEGKPQTLNFTGKVRNPVHIITKAPTQALAIEWMRVNFGIWIACDFDGKNWFEVITILPDKDRHILNSHNSSQEAIESALLYVLTNLIK